MSRPKSSRSLSAQQIRAIGHLLCSRSLSEAAQNAQIPERRIRAWLKSDPAFRAALHDADYEAVAAISRRLVAGQMKALDTLEALMSGATHESVRLRAALGWLTLVIQYRELVDIMERLNAIEAEVFKPSI